MATPTAALAPTPPLTGSATPEESQGSAGGRGFSVPVDEHLLARAKRQDRLAQQQLYHLFAKPVYTLARRLCRLPEDAEDVLQETFLEVFRSLPRFRGEGSFAGWVRRVAVSKVLQKLRQSKRWELGEELGEEELEFAHDPGEGAVVRLALAEALARLPDTARVVMWLHEVEGWSHDEIAALWGKSPSFSKSQLARAYARLRADGRGEGRAR